MRQVCCYKQQLFQLDKHDYRMSKQAYKRLNKEYKQIQANPPPFIIARPSERNILDWHLVITGPPGTPYENGQYHGRITFPSDYPFKPPSIKMCTPSGRFEINTRLCLSMSDFHEESWNPSWSVSTIATGLLSFMTGDERTTGSILTSDLTKRQLAIKSKRYNTYSNLPFKEIFPDIWEKNVNELNQGIEITPLSGDKDGNSNKPSQNIDEKNIEKIVKDIEKIEDPEDRIRARLINGRKADNSHNNGNTLGRGKSRSDKKSIGNNNNNNNSNSIFIVFGLIVLAIIFMNSLGFI